MFKVVLNEFNRMLILWFKNAIVQNFKDYRQFKGFYFNSLCEFIDDSKDEVDGFEWDGYLVDIVLEDIEDLSQQG